MITEPFLTRSSKGIEEIILVFYLLPDVFSRYAGGYADGLFGIFHRVGYRPVTSPTAYQPLVVGAGEGFASHDILYSGTKYLLS